MNCTGVHPSDRSSRSQLTCGIALAALVLGTCSPLFAEREDRTKPRVEKVRDKDGSIWEVKIVPHPLYQPKPICPPPSGENVEPTPVASPLVPPVPGQKPKAAKAKKNAKKTTKATKKPALKKTSPANAEKADSLAGTKLISLQTDKAAASQPKKKKNEKKKAQKKKKTSKMPFGVDIVPRFSYPPGHPASPCVEEAPHAVIEASGCDSAARVNPDDYARIYQSIPFNRSEYIANPSYRHEAAMEILFGKLRPTVVVKSPGKPRPHGTLFPYENNIVRPYSYYSMGPGAGYGRGPLPFASPGAYGVNYNFYYPMPTVYRNY